MEQLPIRTLCCAVIVHLICHDFRCHFLLVADGRGLSVAQGILNRGLFCKEVNLQPCGSGEVEH